MPDEDHTHFAICMTNHTGHQYIIPREIRTDSKVKMKFYHSPSSLIVNLHCKIIAGVCSLVGEHTDHVIFMNNHTGHQYIILRRE